MLLWTKFGLVHSRILWVLVCRDHWSWLLPLHLVCPTSRTKLLQYYFSCFWPYFCRSCTSSETLCELKQAKVKAEIKKWKQLEIFLNGPRPVMSSLNFLVPIHFYFCGGTFLVFVHCCSKIACSDEYLSYTNIIDLYLRVTNCTFIT